MEWVTPREAVDRLRCTKKTLESLIRNGMVGYRREADRTVVGLGSERLLQAMLQKAKSLQKEQLEMKARREALAAAEAAWQQRCVQIEARESARG
jgi:hypothetical protein